jgi:hypothetical protein
VFKDASVTNSGKTLTLRNSDESINLFPGSIKLIMDSIYLVVINSTSLEYYPMWTLTPPTINQPPVADFIYSPLIPVVDQEIIFDASPSFDPDGNISSYWWNISGNIFTTKVVNISFHAAGMYYVGLIVTDNNGATSWAYKLIDVAGSMPIAPANDDFYNSTLIGSLPFNDALSTVDATTAFDDPFCSGNGHTVWYSFTPSDNMIIDANTIGSSYDTTLSAYTGSRGALAQIACNDDYYGVQSRVSFNAFAGQTVFFMVGSFGGGPGGNLNFNVSFIPPPPPPPIPPANDDFSNATVISSLPFIDSVETFNATNAFDDPYSWCAGYWYGHTVWYSFTPTEYTRVEVNPSGSDYSPILVAAYQGTRGSLYQVSCNIIYTDPNYTSQPLVVYTYPNQTLYFMVGSYDGNPGGNLKLKVDILPPLTINLNIDPDGSVNRLTGDAMIQGTMTCSRPVSGSMSINLSQRAGRFNVIRGSSSFQFWCDPSNSTTWKATIRSSDGPYNAGQVYVEAFASAYEGWTGDYAVDDASTVVHLRGKEK